MMLMEERDLIPSVIFYLNEFKETNNWDNVNQALQILDYIYKRLDKKEIRYSEDRLLMCITDSIRHCIAIKEYKAGDLKHDIDLLTNNF